MNFANFCWQLVKQLRLGNTKFKCDKGEFPLYPNKIVPIPTEAGYCWRFVHNAIRIYLNRPLFPVPQPNANTAYKELKKLHKQNDKLLPGSLIFWPGGRYGHVAIYLGDDLILENTEREAGVKEIILGAIKISKLSELADSGITINVPTLIKELEDQH